MKLYSQEKYGESFFFHKPHPFVPAVMQSVPLNVLLSGEQVSRNMYIVYAEHPGKQSKGFADMSFFPLTHKKLFLLFFFISLLLWNHIFSWV